MDNTELADDIFGGYEWVTRTLFANASGLRLQRGWSMSPTTDQQSISVCDETKILGSAIIDNEICIIGSDKCTRTVDLIIKLLRPNEISGSWLTNRALMKLHLHDKLNRVEQMRKIVEMLSSNFDKRPPTCEIGFYGPDIEFGVYAGSWILSCTLPESAFQALVDDISNNRYENVLINFELLPPLADTKYNTPGDGQQFGIIDYYNDGSAKGLGWVTGVNWTRSNNKLSPDYSSFLIKSDTDERSLEANEERATRAYPMLIDALDRLTKTIQLWLVLVFVVLAIAALF